jgi:hypothetical protein
MGPSPSKNKSPSKSPRRSPIKSPEKVLYCTKTHKCYNVGVTCVGVGCTKIVCRNCYEVHVAQKNKIPKEEILPLEYAACTLRCHKKYNLNKVNNQHQEQRIAWDSDTINNVYGGSSESLLLDWLKCHGNYADWRGNKFGRSKKDIQIQLADMINKHGYEKHNIHRNRTEAQVGAKIRYFELQFKKALSFMENTGQGIKESQNLSEECFKDLITRKFVFFWDLYDVMIERSSSKPVFLSENLGSEEDDDDESTEDQSTTKATTSEYNYLENDNGTLEEEDVEETNTEKDDDDEEDGKPSSEPPIDNVKEKEINNETASVIDDNDAMVSPVNNVYIINKTPTRSNSSVAKRLNMSESISSVGVKPKRSKNKNLISGDSVITFIADRLEDKEKQQIETQKLLHKIKMSESQEVMRHNKAMEEIELKKLDQLKEMENKSHAIKTVEVARSVLKFNLEVFEEYNSFREKHKDATLSYIATIFPGFIPCFPPHEVKDDEKEAFKEAYNEWCEQQGLPKTKLNF